MARTEVGEYIFRLAGHQQKHHHSDFEHHAGTSQGGMGETRQSRGGDGEEGKRNCVMLHSMI